MKGLEPSVPLWSAGVWSKNLVAVLVRSGCRVVGGQREYNRMGRKDVGTGGGKAGGSF